MTKRKTSADMADDELFDDIEDGAEEEPDAVEHPKKEAEDEGNNTDGEEPSESDDIAAMGDDSDEDDDEPDEEAQRAQEQAEYSKKVQKRIAKLTSQRKSAEAELAAARKRIAELEQRANNLAQERHSLQSQNVAISERGLAAEAANLQAEIVAAVDEGDTVKQLEAQRKLDEVWARQREVDSFKRQMGQKPESTQQQQSGPHPKGAAWIEAHDVKNWSQDQKSCAQHMDAWLTSQGEDPSNDEYYRKLEGLISTYYPDLFRKSAKDEDDDDDDDLTFPPMKTQPKKRPDTPLASPGTAGKQAKGKTQLTATQISNMKRFGLDPRNAEHVKEYAASIRESS